MSTFDECWHDTKSKKGDELGIDLSQLKGSRKVADDFKAINAPYSSAEEELATVVAETIV